MVPNGRRTHLQHICVLLTGRMELSREGMALRLHDLLPNDHIAVDQVIGGRKGDGDRGLHDAALQVRWD